MDNLEEISERSLCRMFDMNSHDRELAEAFISNEILANKMFNNEYNLCAMLNSNHYLAALFEQAGKLDNINLKAKIPSLISRQAFDDSEGDTILYRGQELDRESELYFNYHMTNVLLSGLESQLSIE